MNNIKPYRIVFVPSPITLAVAFGYFLFRKLGFVTDQTPVKYYPKPNNESAKTGFIEQDCALLLNNATIYEKLPELIRQQPPEVRKLCFDTFSFFQAQDKIAQRIVDGAKGERFVLRRDLWLWLLFRAENHRSPQIPLHRMYEALDNLIAAGKKVSQERLPLSIKRL